jgi:DNA polymerase-3 subunit delta'
MPYQTVFKPFSEIIGQERTISFLKGVMARGKIPHAYLFAGISGVGKTTTALAFTQAINCKEQVNEEACGHCQTCRQVRSGNFPDLVFIEPDGQNIKIEQIRGLNRALSFKPVSGRYRVSIIRQAEAMTDEAANSLLKTLEEPPPNNLIILNVTEPLAMFPTIVSRCQRVLFRPIPPRAIADCLMDSQSVDKDRAHVLAKISEGSLGKAIRMSEGEFIKNREYLISRLIQVQGLSSEEALEMALEYKQKRKALDSEDMGKGEWDLFDLLSIWKSWYRDLLLTKLHCPTDFLVNVDFSQKLKNISRHFKIENLMESFHTVDRSQRDLLQTRNVDITMEHTILDLRRLASEENNR